MNNTVRGTIITLFGASCWGLCAVSGKFAVSERGVDPVWMVCLRLIIAGLVFLAIEIMISGRKAGSSEIEAPGEGAVSGAASIFDIWKDRSSVIRLILVAVFAFAVCQASYFAAIDCSNAGTASAIQQTAPVFVMLYNVLLLRQTPRLVELISLVTVMAGVWLLATHGEPGGLIIPGRALFWGLVSAVTCAGYTVMPQPLVKRYGTLKTAGWGMLAGGLFLVPVCRLWNVSGTWDSQTVLAFAYVVIMGTLVAFGCFLYGVSIVGTVRGSIYGLIEPVMAFLMSVIVLGHSYAAADYLGCAAIIGGVLLLVLTDSRASLK